MAANGAGVVAPQDRSRTVVARNVFYLVIGQVTSTALAIVFNAALGRFLGTDEFGRYYLLVTMVAFAYVFVEWGQPTFVIPHVARHPSEAGDMVGTALALRAAFTAVVGALVLLVALASGFDARTSWLSVALVGASLPLFHAQTYGMVFRAHDQMGFDTAVSVANKVVVLAVSLPLLALGSGIPGVILAQACAGLTAAGVAAWLYRRLHATPLRATVATAKQLLIGGTPIVLMTAAVAAQPYLDALILSRLAPATALGWFGAARTVSGTLSAPAAILGSALYPRLARSAPGAALRLEVKAALRPLLWLGGLAACGTYLFAGTAVSLIYGRDGFGPAATLLAVSAPGLFLVFVNMMLTVVIYAIGRGTGFAMTKIASVALAVGLDLLLIPYFQRRFGNGGIGVVVAFALAELVVLAAAVIVLRRREALDARVAMDVARALGAVGATLLLFRQLPPISPWIGIPLCILSFAGASAAFGLVGPRDLRALGAALRPKAAEA